MDIAHKVHQIVCLLEKRGGEILEKHTNLTFSQFLILLALNKHTNVTQREIAYAMKISPAAVSRHIENLVEKDYIERLENKDNRRRNTISLSKLGESAFHEAHELLDRYLDENLTILRRWQRRKVSGFLDTIIDSLEK